MKVGDYVRNSHYGIGKINGEYDYKNEHWYNVKFAVHDEDDEEYHCGICERSIGFKTSPNLIDLIEVGDYVNGHRVNYINKDREHFNISFGNEDFNLKSKFNSDIYWLSKEDIKSIVTKEQFEAMKYEIK